MIKTLLRFLAIFFYLMFSAGILFAVANRSIHRKSKPHKIQRVIRHVVDNIIITSTGGNTICSGGSITLTASPAPNPGLYKWFKDGVALPGATFSSYTASTGGSYSVDVTDNGETLSYPAIVISEVANPVAAFTFLPGGECSSVPVNFISTSTGVGLVYAWDFGDPNSNANNTSSEQNPNHQFLGNPGNGIQTFIVKLTVTSSSGCTSTTSLTVMIKQHPDADLDATGEVEYDGQKYFTSCTSSISTLSFSNNSSTPLTNKNYVIQWGDGSPDFQSATFSTVIDHVYNVGVYTLKMTVTGQNDCTQTSFFYVFIGSNPAVGLGNPGNTSVCTGQALNFPITGTANNPPGTVYKITFNDGSTPIIYNVRPPDIISHVFLKSSCGTSSNGYANAFSATIQASNPCNSSSATVSPIYVSEKPKAEIRSASDISCINKDIIFTNSSVKGNNVANGTCNSGKSIWTVTPLTGVTLVGGTYGEEKLSYANSIIGSDNITLKFSTPGTYVVRLKILTGNIDCGTDVITKTICINPIPTSSFNLDVEEGCNPLTVKTTNTSPAPDCGANTYNWSVSPSTGVVFINSTNATSPNPEFVFNNSGNYTISLVTTSPGGGCTSAAATHLVKVNAKPVIVLNASATLCEGTSMTPRATVNSTTPATYLWTFQGGTPSTSISDNPGTIIYNIAGNYTTTLAVTNVCGVTTTTAAVIVKSTPVVAVPLDQIYCADVVTSIRTSTSNVPGTTYTWTNNNPSIGLTATSGTGNIPSFTTKNAGNTPLTAIITVIPKAGDCTGQSVFFKITVNPKPSAPSTTQSIYYCLNEIPVALSATVASGNTLNWYANTLQSAKLPAAPVPSTTNPGTSKYYVTQSNGSQNGNIIVAGCESAATEIIVTVYPLIANNTISANQILCYNSTAAPFVQQVTLTGGTGAYIYQWQSSADGNIWTNITNANSAGYSPGTLIATTQYRRLVTSGSCTSTSNVITITVQGQLSNVNITANQNICYGTTPVLLVGQIPIGGSGSYIYQWESSTDGLNWNVINATNTPDYQPGALISTVYYRRSTSSGICFNYSNLVKVLVNPIPVLNPLSSKVYCYNNATDAFNFSSSTVGTITYKWTNDNSSIGLAGSGLGNIAAFNLNNTGKKPIVSNVTVIPIITTDGLSCEGSPVIFSITALPKITIQTIPDQNACSGATIIAIPITNDAETFAGGAVSYKWIVSNTSVGLQSGSGLEIPAFVASNSTTTNQVSTVTVIPVYSYNSKQCDGSPGIYTITVNPKSTIANAGIDSKTCGTTFQLNGNTLLAGSGLWTKTSGPAAILTNPAQAATTVTDLIRGNRYEFTWAIDNGCSPTAASVKIDVLSDIVNTIKTPLDLICSGELVVLRTDQLTGGDVPGFVIANYSYSWESSADGINWQLISSATAATLSINPAADTYYRRIISSYNLCPKISNVVHIMIRPSPPPASAGNNVILCNESSYLLNGSDPGVSFTGTWTVLTANTTLAFSPDIHSRNAVINGLQPGINYELKWTITNGSCGETSATVNIVNLYTLSNQISLAVTTVCSGVPSTITGSLPTGGIGTYEYIWQTSTDGQNWTTITGERGKDLIHTFYASSQVRRTVNSGACTLQSNTVNIIVQAPITNNSISGPLELCTGKTAALTGTLPVGGDGNFIYQWQLSTNGTTWANISGGNQADLLTQPLTESSYFRRLVGTILCAGAQQSTGNAIHVIVNQDSKADFTASTIVGCAPLDLKRLITTIKYDDRNATYEWFANGTSIGSGSDFPAYSIVGDGETAVIRLLTTSKFGCDTSSKVMTFTTVKSVIASFTKNQVKGCGPLNTHFVNTSTPLAGGTYLWDFGNGQTSTKAQPDDVVFRPHPLSLDTTYIIKLKASTPCGDTYFTDSVLVRPPSRAIFTPDKTIGCSPFEINISNQSRGLPNTYTFDFGNGETKVRTDNSDFKYTYYTTKTDTLTLKMVSENECGKDSSSYQIVVYPNAVKANLVVNGDNKFGCAPVVVKFDNNSIGANSFTWDFDDGNTATTSSAPESMIHTFTSPGVYTVKLTATNGCSTASTTQVITVYKQPDVAFSVAKLQYCVRDSVVFINQAAQAMYTYKWDFNDGTISNDTNPKHVYTRLGIYHVALTISRAYADGSVCSNTVIHDVEIIPTPIANFNTNSAALNCAPFTLITNSTPANASGVEWDFGDPGSIANTANGYSATHTFDKPGTYKVRIIAYNLAGCIDSAYQIIKVSQTPVVTFTPGDSVLCGATTTIDFRNKTTYSGTDLLSYKWYVNNVPVSSSKDLKYTFTPPLTAVFPYQYTIKLVATTTIGCTETVSHNIQFNALPKAAFNVKVAASCIPFAVEITNTSVYSDQYRWYLDGLLISSDLVPSSLVLEQQSKTYKLKLVVSNLYGCKTDSVEKILTTYPKPKAVFSLIDSVSCNGLLSIRITNTTTGASSYTWNFGDGSPESPNVVPVHNYGIPGIYTLRLIAFNGVCRDTTSHQIEIARPPKSIFTADVIKGCTKLAVQFNNVSENARSYYWDFGDGTYSTAKNPLHTFNYLKSPYTVKLMVYGDFDCSDEVILLDKITVSAPPRVDFSALPDSVIKIPNLTFTFTNQTTNGLSYKWEFGDGKTSVEKDPLHTYLDTGTYKVKLTALNKEGCTSFIIRTVQITGVPQYLYVPNAFEPGNSKSELQTFNVRGSGMVSYSLKIFSKWGQLLFQTTALDNDGAPVQGWAGDINGKPAPQGVYIWDINAKFLDGTVWHGMQYKDGKSPSTTGNIHLIR